MPIIFFVLGLMLGSFINVIVHRLDLAESLVSGRSRCPHCKGKIRWYDNVPALSFIVLKARCRDCKEKISWQYPVVEILAGVLFAAVGAKFFVLADAASWISTVYWLGVVCFLLAIAAYDFLKLEIPDVFLWPAVFWTLGFGLYFDWANRSGAGISDGHIYSGILAAMAAFSFFFLLSAVSKEKWMGMGDAYLAIFLGLFLGWTKILLGLMLAFAIGALSGIALIVFKKKKMKSQLPFAPFLVIGSLIALFFYAPITEWYFGLFY